MGSRWSVWRGKLRIWISNRENGMDNHTLDPAVVAAIQPPLVFLKVVVTTRISHIQV